jgi:hypothetical protein
MSALQMLGLGGVILMSFDDCLPERQRKDDIPLVIEFSIWAFLDPPAWWAQQVPPPPFF